MEVPHVDACAPGDIRSPGGLGADGRRGEVPGLAKPPQELHSVGVLMNPCLEVWEGDGTTSHFRVRPRVGQEVDAPNASGGYDDPVLGDVLGYSFAL